MDSFETSTSLVVWVLNCFHCQRKKYYVACMLFLQNPSHFRPPYGTRSLQAYRTPLLVYHIQKRKVFFDYFPSIFFIIYDVFDTTISSCIRSLECIFLPSSFNIKKKEPGTGASRRYDQFRNGQDMNLFILIYCHNAASAERFPHLALLWFWERILANSQPIHMK